MLRAILTLMSILGASSYLSGSAPLGELLETNLWNEIEKKNYPAIERMLAPNFKGVLWFDIQDKEKSMQLIKALDINSYKLKQMESSQEEDTIVVTYWASVAETINGTRTKGKPFPRASVWQKNQGEWQLVLHTNLNPDESNRILIKAQPVRVEKEILY